MNRFAKLVKVPIDMLQLVSKWSNMPRADAFGVLVEGLFIQGCRFDGLRISECRAEDSSLAGAPQTYLCWLPQVSVVVHEKFPDPHQSRGGLHH